MTTTSHSGNLPSNSKMVTSRFPIRGINPCESLARHTPMQIESLLQRIEEWKVNHFIAHTGYGWKQYGARIKERCSELGVKILYYIYMNLEFLADGFNPDWVALNEQGCPHTTRLEVKTRLCASNLHALEGFRRAAQRYFERSDLEPGSAIIFTDADEYLPCHCDRCKDIPAREQTLRFILIALEEAERAGLDPEPWYLAYGMRYTPPEDVATLERFAGIMFDTHLRQKAYKLGEDHPMTGVNQLELDHDPNVAEKPINIYLAERLLEWRRMFEGPIFVFENLMIQGGISCPIPCTTTLLGDLDFCDEFGINGVVYEAFEPGIRSYDDQLTTLYDALINRKDRESPSPFERLYRSLPEPELVEGDPINFSFRHLRYLSLPEERLEDILSQEGVDVELMVYLRLLRAYLANRTLDHYMRVMAHVRSHADRFDWLLIAFRLIRVLNHDQQIEPDSDRERDFLKIDKLWDFMEGLEDPYHETAQVVDGLMKRLPLRAEG